MATFGEDTSGRGGANNSGQSSGIFNGGYGAFAQLVFNTVGYTAARALGNGTKGDASSWNYAVTLAFPDLGKKGNLGGIVVGMQPQLRVRVMMFLPVRLVYRLIMGYNKEAIAIRAFTSKLFTDIN